VLNYTIRRDGAIESKIDRRAHSAFCRRNTRTENCWMNCRTFTPN
jgi:hypothetical protein